MKFEIKKTKKDEFDEEINNAVRFGLVIGMILSAILTWLFLK